MGRTDALPSPDLTLPARAGPAPTLESFLVTTPARLAPGGAVAPDVTVVVPTRGRPELLTAALASIAAQDYAGVVETIVVFDGSDPDRVFASNHPTRPVRVVRNHRKPGPAGGRNTGILAATGDLIAFLDDDDLWCPDKLSRQVQALVRSGRRTCVSTISVRQGDQVSDRPLPQTTLSLRDLLRSRTQEAHQSTVVVRREFLLHEVGLYDEQVPGSYGEDYDWLLRAAAIEPIEVVPLPLVEVRWHETSWFFDRWALIIEALTYLTAKHPGLATDPKGAAVLTGRMAYSHAALGQRRAALREVRRTVRRNPGEMRWVLTLPLIAHPAAALPVMKLLRRTTGRSI